jgi:hypothetical protein
MTEPSLFPSSQNVAILSYLKSGRSLTGLEALSRFGTSRLAARIHDLKTDERYGGPEIEARAVNLNGKRVAEYRMAG